MTVRSHRIAALWGHSDCSEHSHLHRPRLIRITLIFRWQGSPGDSKGDLTGYGHLITSGPSFTTYTVVLRGGLSPYGMCSLVKGL